MVNRWIPIAIGTGMITSGLVLVLGHAFRERAVTEVRPTALPAAAAALRISTPTATATATPAAIESEETALLAFQSGDYARAVEILRKLNHAAPDNEQVRSNLSVALYALALFRIQQNAYPDADGLLEESAGLGFHDATRMLARLRIRTGNTGTIEETLQTVLERDEDPRTLAVLVDLALARDDLESAEVHVRRLENAREERPDVISEGFVKARADRIRIRRTLAEGAQSIDGTSASVSYSLPAHRNVAQAVARSLDDTVGTLSQLFVPPQNPEAFRAVIVPEESFQATTGAPPWAGAFFDGIIRIPAPRAPNQVAQAYASRVARHEMTHAYLHSFCGNLIPSWLHEGLAMTVEGISPRTSMTVLRVRRGNRAMELPNPEVFDDSFLLADPDEVSELYARAHLLVNVLDREAGRDVWRALVSDTCQDGDALGGFLTQRFGASTGVALWERYRNRIPTLVLGAREGGE